MEKEINFEGKLWQTADKLRNNMDAAEYKHVVLGLIFLKYISDAFKEVYDELKKDPEGLSDPEDKDEYKSRNDFWVPREARWDHIQKKAKQPTIGKDVDDAMDAIERDNPSLKGVLPKNYARPALDKQRLGELIDLIGTIGLGDKESKSKDILGRVYEYFLGQFADAEGKKGGQFYTPRCIVKLLVEMLEPYKGRVFDPCCGSGGMFVQSEKFVKAHGGRIGDISIYGQESNQTTWRLCKMNLAIRGIDANIQWNNEGSFLKDAHQDLKADFILANPPFNDSDWKGESLRDDKRWKYGAPPTGNANFAWVQHFIYHLAPSGLAGFVLGNIALTSEMGGEDIIRKAIINADIIDCIVTFPDKLFYSTPIPASIWIIRRSRASSSSNNVRKKEILFIDASKLGKNVTRTHSELTDKDITTIAQTYRLWLTRSNNYADKKGFCRSVSVKEVFDNKYNLLPASYVNAGHTKASQSLKVRDLLLSPDKDIAAQALKQVTDLSLSFNDLIKRFGMQNQTLEKIITFKTYTLNELLERSDERLGNKVEPEILTCTEKGGLILQRERFAKRVATEDTRKYKIVRMGDIVYNPYLLWKGAIDQCWIVKLGITSPAYEVLRVRLGFDKTIIGQLVTSAEMIKRYDGISFGTVQRRRRAPVEKYLELKVNYPSLKYLTDLTALLSVSKECQFACRDAERAIRSLLKNICTRLR